MASLLKSIANGVLGRSATRTLDGPPCSPPPNDPWPGVPDGATVLFLDFDGVLHCAANESFERMPQLEWLLDQRPDLALVLSTDWRLNSDQDFLRRPFPDSVWERIGGVTPHLRQARPQREVECLAFAAGEGVKRYVAVDDDVSVFSADCPFLFRTDRYRALDWDATKALLDLLNERFPQPDSAEENCIRGDESREGRS